MTIPEFMILVGIFILIMVFYRRADRWIKGLEPDTIKTVNWAGFIMAVIGGTLWYFYNHNAFMFLTLTGIVIYFLFYNYDEEEEKGGG